MSKKLNKNKNNKEKLIEKINIDSKIFFFYYIETGIYF